MGGVGSCLGRGVDQYCTHKMPHLCPLVLFRIKKKRHSGCLGRDDPPDIILVGFFSVVCRFVSTNQFLYTISLKSVDFELGRKVWMLGGVDTGFP